MIRFTLSLVAIIFTLATWDVAIAHPGHSHGKTTYAAGADGPSSDRNWVSSAGTFRERGSFVMAREGIVQIRRADDSLVTLPIDLLASDDQQWVVRRMTEIRLAAELRRPMEVLLAQRDPLPNRAAPGQTQAPEIARAFEVFAKRKAITTRWDDRYFYVESNGMPDHPMMVGITAWQQQVPIPQKYVGENAWQIPLHPVPAKNPQSAKGNFLRGAIALAANGIPIFNPLNNRGDDAYLFGELDEYGGHCGRADDYHYHIAPVHLQKTVGKGLPIAYALDGYPIYGYEEPDGSAVKGLDVFNGHKDANGNYHYHATKTYPYLNGGFYGEVIERDGQVDPQPRAEPLRPALPPLRDAKITAFKETRPGSYLLTYDLKGKKGTVAYSLVDDGSAQFTFTDPAGKSSTETYQRRERRGGGNGGPGQQPPPRPGENSPRGKGKKAPPNEGRSAPGGDANQPAPPSAGDRTAKPRSNLPQLSVTSSSVDAKGFVSVDCTCDGASQSPAVEWKDAPQGTKSFAISLWHTAPDQEKSYWVVYNIPANVTKLQKNSKSVGQLGVNDRRRAEYDPMCSKGPGVKLYHITVFALSSELKLSPDKASRAALLDAIKDQTLAEGTLDFQYERRK